MARHFILLVYVSFLLSACGHVSPPSEWGNSGGEDNSGEQYSDYVSTYVNGRVEVYDLSDDATTSGPLVFADESPVPQTAGAIMPAPIQSQTIAPIGRTAGEDSRVTVFPFEEYENHVNPRQGTPDMIPPSQYKQEFPSPFSQKTDPANTDRVFFAHGSAAIDQKGRQVIGHVSDKAKDNAVHLVNVVGHASKRAQTADPVQRAILNMRMSMKRAMAVSEALVAKGVSANVIKTSALGDTTPMTVMEGQSQEAADRRVEIATVSSSASSLNKVGVVVPNRILDNGSSGEQSDATPVTLFPLN